MTARPLTAGLALAAVLASAMAAPFAPASAQSRIKDMPGYANWSEMSPRIPAAGELAPSVPVWNSDSRSFEYTFDGRRWRYDARRRKASDIGTAPLPVRTLPGTTGSPSETPLVLARGRGADAEVTSPDGKWRAFSHDHNVWLAARNGEGQPLALSMDGGAQARIRNGVGSYVYLEEFNVRSPVWWSPDSRKIAWMRFDEAKVDDYFLPLGQTKMLSSVLTQAYPHPGGENPVPDYRVHDVKSGQTITLDVRDGQPFSNDVVGHYAWSGDWTKDGKELLINRADRLQKVFDLAACSAETGACRSVVREERPQSWASSSRPVFLDDGKRFIWVSERSGYRNFYLYHLDGRQLATLTNHAFDVIDIERVDERDGELCTRPGPATIT
jgi:dipeptidyl-peptidase-4